jgi:multiple sugar transport system permease protein
MATYFLNSLIITLPTVFGAIAISTMAGFVLAKYGFKGNMLLFAMCIAGNFIPFQILMIPVRNLTIELGMYDSYPALILFYIAFQAGFCTLFMRNFIKALPHELIEAARVEGATEFQIFFRIVLPPVLDRPLPMAGLDQDVALALLPSAGSAPPGCWAPATAGTGRRFFSSSTWSA